jgi:hypothetical protein
MLDRLAMCMGTWRAKLAGCYLIDGGLNPTHASKPGCRDAGIARMTATNRAREARCTAG